MKKDLPGIYMGYPVEELLAIHKDFMKKGETKAPKEKIRAKNRLVREYKLSPVFQNETFKKKL